MERSICEKLDNYCVCVCIVLLDPKILHEKVLGILAFLTMPATFVERIALLDLENILFG